MVNSPPSLMLDGKCCKKNQSDGKIRSPPSMLSSSYFDSEYLPTNNEIRKRGTVDDEAKSILCSNKSDKLKLPSKGQQNKTIAFSGIMPKHASFSARNDSPRKVGLAPRLQRRRKDGLQCNNFLGTLSKNNLSEQNLEGIDSYSSATFEPPASPSPHTSSSSLLSSSIDVFSYKKSGHDEENDKGRSGFFDEFTLTPTCLYDDEEEKDGLPRHSQSVPPKLYHKSPHWSGRVNINPFSPVPEHYLNPPSSSMSPTFPFLGPDKQEDVLLPEENTSPNSPDRKKKKRSRLAPTKMGPSLFQFHPPGASGMASKLSNDDMGGDKKRKTATHHDKRTQPNKRICHQNQRSRYLDDFQEIQLLGSGSFGTVCACLSRLDGCMYAIKSISPDGVAPKSTATLYGGRRSSTTNLVPPTPRRDVIPLSARRHKAQSRISPKEDEHDEVSPQMVLRGSRHWSENTLNRMLREVFALAALCNQSDLRTFHIVRYHQAWLEEDGNLYIQTELCKATVRDEMKAGKIDVSRQFKILREILLALQLVHESGCVHLDIKADNIFVCLVKDLFKLGDFGTATLRDEINTKTGKAMDVEEGDSRYMPRDLLEGTPEDLTKCDIFSLGITLYEICVGDKPLPLCGQGWHDLRDGKFPKPSEIDPTLYFIIKQMMHPSPSKRPSASELLARNELLSVDSATVLNKAVKIPSASTKGARPFPLKRERSLSWT